VSMLLLAQRLAEPDVASLPDWQAAEALNLPDPSLPHVWLAVSCGRIRAYLLSSGNVWTKLKLARSDSALTEETRKIAETVYDALDLLTHIDLSNSSYRSLVENNLASLVDAGVLSQLQVDGLLALGRRHPTWAEANNVLVDARSVGLARGARE
jgi:hypothetical protein